MGGNNGELQNCVIESMSDFEVGNKFTNPQSVDNNPGQR